MYDTSETARIQTYLDFSVQTETQPVFCQENCENFEVVELVKFQNLFPPRGVKNGLNDSCYCRMVLQQTYLDIIVEIQEYRPDFGKRIVKKLAPAQNSFIL